VTDNYIHHIHVQCLFEGAEQAGIKFHAPIDSIIARNEIHDTFRAIWMDWMTQGTRITQNLCYNNKSEDLFMEVNHGPFVVDNNLFLSEVSLVNWSEWGAYLHNLFGGKINCVAEHSRETPYHRGNSLEIEGIVNIKGGDDRYINNLIADRESLEMAVDLTREARTRDATDSLTLEGAEVNKSILVGNHLLSDAYNYEVSEDKIVFNLESEEIATCDTITGDDLESTTVSQKPFKNYDGSDLYIKEAFWRTCLEGTRHVGPWNQKNTTVKIYRKIINKKS
jgi:hypothetical protein